MSSFRMGTARLEVALRYPILKDSLEDTLWLCPGYSERAGTPALQAGWEGGGSTVHGLTISTVP